MQNLCGSFLDKWYNTKFSLNQYIYGVDKQLRIKDKIIHILNQTIKNDIGIEQRMDKLKETCQKIIWFSYRKRIPKFQISSLTSDTGWGCMIRVAQMALAQIIKHFHSFTKEEQLIVLIRHFIDDDEDELSDFIKQKNKNQIKYYHAPFSIQKIVYYAKIELNKEPGEWYKPNEILLILEQLFKYSQYSINMDIYINYDCAFILQDAIKQMYNYDKGNEEWLNNQISNNIKFQQQVNKGIAVFLPARIGLQNVNKDNLLVLNNLMTLPYFHGIIGGAQNKAFYIVGRIQDYYIYLDPHFVQTAQNFDDLSKSHVSYSCQDIQLINNELIDPSIVICLCISNEIELLNLWQILNKMKEEYQEHFFISLLETNDKIEKIETFDYLNENHELVSILQ
ncbi:unnamed protein product [Paramecium sonneborni]|uniref:Cysteine protease n=1 Tax=Paramecium sonneborni TaxID=65129 RepID=A0A8S1LL63_9CILI|nr:unnamed protein product [Paramecium sonneborni]